MAVGHQSKPAAARAGDVLVGVGPWGRLGFAVEVLGFYARVRWLVLRRGAVAAVPALRGELSEHVVADPDGLLVLRGLLFARSVMGVLNLLPADSRCLMRSLVLTGLLARRGVYSTVVLGVRAEPAFAAHAWVELDGRPILPTDESTYRRLTEV